MAGIADSPVAPLQLNSAEQAGNFAVSPAVGDLMSGFKSGFITAEDIQKRALDKPLENAKRQQDLADTNLIRPKARVLAGQQMDVQGQQLGNTAKEATIKSGSLDKQAEIQPKLDDASLLQAGEMLASAERGQDKGALLNFYQTVANPGQLPPRIDPNDPASDYDYAKVADENRKFLKDQRELQKATALGKFIKTFSAEVKDAAGNTTSTVTRINEATGQNVGTTVIGTSPKQKTQIGESETQRLAQARSAKANLTDIKTAFENLVKGSPNLVGPVAGRLVGPVAGEYDKLYQLLENAINKTVPGLARGVFGEVGVLTDRDVDRYTRLLPTARKDPTIARALLEDITQTVDRAERTLLDTYDKRGSDVSGFRNETAPAPGTAPSASPASPDAPVSVQTPAEAPVTAKFILMPNGKTYKNPKYVPTP